jgi:hypothetical protein
MCAIREYVSDLVLIGRQGKSWSNKPLPIGKFEALISGNPKVIESKNTGYKSLQIPLILNVQAYEREAYYYLSFAPSLAGETHLQFDELRIEYKFQNNKVYFNTEQFKDLYCIAKVDQNTWQDKVTNKVVWLYHG